MLNQLQIDFYKENGYLVIENLFPIKLISSIFSDIKAIFATQYQYQFCEAQGNENSIFELFKEAPEIFKNCGKVSQNLPEVHKLGLNNKIEEILEDIKLGFPVISTRPVVFFNHPDLAEEEIYNKTPPHQDFASVQGSPDGVVLWLPLVNVDSSLGPLEVIPKSHLQGLQSTSYDHNFGLVPAEQSEFVSLPVKVGDLILFSQMLVHQSGNNTSPNIRWSVSYRYANLNSWNWIKRGYYTPYTYKPECTEEGLRKLYDSLSNNLSNYL